MANKEKAPSRKRATSPAKGARVSKRLQVQTQVPRPPLSVIISQHGSALLSLPRETRDQIYTEILEELSLTFRVDKLIVAATHNPGTYIKPSQRLRRGLPLWLLSSQQILYEVLDLIARTFTFEPSGWPIGPEREISGVPNPLVFTNDGVRNIKINTGIRYFSEDRDTTLIGDQAVPFLKLMDRLSLKDAYLELVWRKGHKRGSWGRKEVNLFTQEWREHWNGRFRRVKIHILDDANLEQEGAPMLIMDEAEKCAVRLVGTGSMSWKNLGHCYIQYSGFFGISQEWAWIRHGTVERKV